MNNNEDKIFEPDSFEWRIALLTASTSPQYYFILSKQGWRFNRGYWKGHLVQDLYEENVDHLKDYLKQVYNHHLTNIHTKMVLKEIYTDIFLNKKQ